MQYQYRDRRRKRRTLRQQWILTVSNACKEHDVRYSRFINALNDSNIKLNRKILADLAVNEPYSFKATLDQVMSKTTIAGALIQNQQAKLSYEEALQKGFLSFQIPEKEPEIPELRTVSLRFPERDAKTERDYLRISFREEDEKWKEERKLQQLSLNEQKKLPREVIDDNWQENMDLYEHKKWTK